MWRFRQCEDGMVICWSLRGAGYVYFSVCWFSVCLSAGLLKSCGRMYMQFLERVISYLLTTFYDRRNNHPQYQATKIFSQVPHAGLDSPGLHSTSRLTLSTTAEEKSPALTCSSHETSLTGRNLQLTVVSQSTTFTVTFQLLKCYVSLF